MDRRRSKCSTVILGEGSLKLVCVTQTVPCIFIISISIIKFILQHITVKIRYIEDLLDLLSLCVCVCVYMYFFYKTQLICKL
jgi:hypothetical protein